jgi:hypothetical protein
LSRVKRVLAAAVVSASMLTMMAAPAFAHQGGPCLPEGDPAIADPGNSEFAKHHIVPFATEGDLGAGGHKPGTHQGFSLCIHDTA